MDPSYNLRNFFLKSVSAFAELQRKESVKLQKKIILAGELEDDLFFLKESVKKMFREHKIKQKHYDLLVKRISMIHLEVKKTKKELISL